MRDNYNGFDDAIPVKRSKKSEKIRREARAEAERNRRAVEMKLSAEPQMRVTPKAPTQKPVQAPANRQSTPAGTAQTAARQPRTVSGVAADAPQKTAAPARSFDPVKRAESRLMPKSKPAETEAAPAPQAQVKSDVPAAAMSAQPKKTQNAPQPLRGAVQQDPHKGDATAPRRTFRDIEAAQGSAAGKPATTSRDVALEEIFSNEPPRTRKLTTGKIIRRVLLCIFTAIIFAVGTVYSALYTVAHGPSTEVRNFLVLSALHSSGAQWVPRLFLDEETVEQIKADSMVVNTDVISIEDYNNQSKDTDDEETDKWANAIDGMLYETVSGPTFKGYVLLIRDPSRVKVGVAVDKFDDTVEGMRIFEMADKYGAVAAINGGEYPDHGGMGIGGRPIGITYSEGQCVWDDGLRRTFMGFDKDNKLIVREGLTRAEADEMGIRDGVCFQTGNTLISNDGGNITMYYADNNTGTAQRTAIGQAADGTVILLVTDGRTASSLGATHNDVIDVMVSYGAVSAGMLDGGSSSLMYYRDYYTKYGIDENTLDEYQKKGLINKYKAFTTPRRLPTCFIVAGE